VTFVADLGFVQSSRWDCSMRRWHPSSLHGPVRFSAAKRLTQRHWKRFLRTRGRRNDTDTQADGTRIGAASAWPATGQNYQKLPTLFYYPTRPASAKPASSRCNLASLHTIACAGHPLLCISVAENEATPNCSNINLITQKFQETVRVEMRKFYYD